MNTCELRIYDDQFNWLGIVRNAESVQYTREHYGCGSFEIHLQPDKRDANLLRERNHIIILNGDYHKAGVIRDFYMEEDRQGARLVIYGDTPDGFAKQRITIPPTKAQSPEAFGWDRVRGSCESILKHYVKRNMGAEAEEKRRIPNLDVAPDQCRGIEFPWQNRYQPLEEELTAIAEYGDMGWEIVADPPAKQWVFEVCPGTDRTYTQTACSPVTFQMAYTNIGSYRYTENYQNYRSTGYAGGQGEDEDRLVYTIGSGFGGQERWEVFLDCGTAEDIDELIYYGNQKLAEFTAAKTITADSLPRVFTFEKDYYLGDKVSLYIQRLDMYMDTRITGVTEVWERQSGYHSSIRFGEKQPNIYRLLKTSQEVR